MSEGRREVDEQEQREEGTEEEQPEQEKQEEEQPEEEEPEEEQEKQEEERQHAEASCQRSPNMRVFVSYPYEPVQKYLVEYDVTSSQGCGTVVERSWNISSCQPGMWNAVLCSHAGHAPGHRRRGCSELMLRGGRRTAGGGWRVAAGEGGRRAAAGGSRRGHPTVKAVAIATITLTPIDIWALRRVAASISAESCCEWRR